MRGPAGGSGSAGGRAEAERPSVRVVFLGNAPWSVPSLEALAGSSHDVIRVITRVARPAGRGSALRPTPVAEAARDLRLPLFEVESVKMGPGFEAIALDGFDVLCVVAYGEILPASVLRLPGMAPVNLHFSLLPELRGATPVQWAILAGMAVTGVSTIRMDEGMDTGPVLGRAEEAIADGDDAGSLGARLAAIGGRLIVDTLDRLADGSLREEEQDESRATYAPKLRPEDRVIRWGEDMAPILRRIRAMAPEPGAETTFRGKRLKILRATGRFLRGPPSLKSNVVPGTLLAVSGVSLAVHTSHGIVAPLEVQPEGRRRMAVEEFVHGHRPEPGERLG